MRSWIWVVVAVLVLGVAAWFAGGKDLFGGGSAIDRTTDGGSESERGGDATRSTSDADAAAEAARGGTRPVLFGRPSAEKVGVGSVVGKVMDFATGKPVAGARVVLAGTGHAQESVQARAQTGADGALAIRDVASGEGYSLRVDAEGQAPRALPSVAVAAGEVLDLGTIWLGKKGALEGVVVDGEGKPIADAVVTVHRSLGPMAEMMKNMMEMIERLDEEPTPLGKSQTDRAGRFKIDDLAPGPQTLLVRASGFARRWQQVAMTSEGAAGGEVKVVLQRGQTAGGKVVDEQGAGIAGARVAVLTNSGGPEEFFYGRSFTETAHDGSFRIDVLPDSSDLTALAAARGYPNTFAKVRAGADDAVIVLHKIVPLNLRLVTKEGGSPVAGASVIVSIDDTSEMSEMPGTLLFGRSDGTGRVALQARPGKLQMAMVTHPDFAMNMWMGGRTMPGLGGMEGPEDPTVPADGADVTFRLQSGILVTGRVTGPAGEPIVGARVLSAGGMMGGQPSLTDAEGRYRMSSPAMGDVGAVAVMVRANGYVQPPESMGAKAEAGAKEVVHDVRLERAAAVTGRVVDATGAPRAGATVSLVGGSSNGMEMFLGSGSSNVSAEDGSYLLEDASAGEGVRAVGHLEGYVDSRSDAFDVKAGTTASAPPIVMRLGVGVDVTVLEPAGAPASGARVEVQFERESRGAMRFSLRDEDNEAFTGEDGVARFPHLPGGKLTLTVSKRGFAASQVETEAPKDEGVQHAVTVRLRKASPIRGVVKDLEGKPMAGARVRVQGSGKGDDWVQWMSQTTKADGAFVFEEAPDRPLKVQASKEGFAESAVDADRVREGLELVLRPTDPRVARRREEVTQQMTALYEQYQAAKDEAEKKALLQKIQELSKELRDDTGGN